MITACDDDMGYTDPAITEREAIRLLHEHYPTATIEPVEGNPNVLGWHLFKVFDRPSGVPRRIYVTHDGEAIEMEVNVTVEGQLR